MWLDRTQIWVQNSLNKNGSNVADLYAALRRRMRTTAAGSHSTSPDQELHIYVGSVCLNSVLNVKAVVAVFNQEKALVGALSVIVQPVVELMDRFAALIKTLLDLLLIEGAPFSSHRRSSSSPLPRPNLILSRPCD